MSINKSIYEELILESNDQKRSVDIRTGTIALQYFEDIFSPTITAKLKVVNTGNTITSFKDDDGETQSIYNGLPLRGGERLSMKIAGNVPGRESLDFSQNSKKYLYVSSITDIISEGQQESFTLNLVSREAITNETSRVMRKYQTASKISDSVKKILTDVLKTDNIGTIDETSNRYGFIGNMRKPFTVLVWLASKSVPVSSGDVTAGFVFYQTRDGFQFRSIDNLISKQKPKAKYVYSSTTVSYDEKENKVDNEFKILNYFIEKNQNLIEKLRLGAYASHRTFFNPLTFYFTEYEKGVFKLKDYENKTNNLGGNDLKLPKLSEGSDLSIADAPSRIITAVLDIGKAIGRMNTVMQNCGPIRIACNLLKNTGAPCSAIIGGTNAQPLIKLIPINHSHKATINWNIYLVILRRDHARRTGFCDQQLIRNLKVFN